MSKLVVFTLSVLFLAVTSAMLFRQEPFKRLIPADVLRDTRNRCFASTQCQFYKPNDTWSLAPFCGRSRCVALRAEDGGVQLAEEVTDCGPIVDLEKTTGCTLLEDEYSLQDDYPGCCPVYDCVENTEIFYHSKVADKDKETPRSSN